MPDLKVTVTASQAARIAPALSRHYTGTALETAPLATQAQDFIMSTVRALVREYERAQAVATAVAAVEEL